MAAWRWLFSRVRMGFFFVCADVRELGLEMRRMRLVGRLGRVKGLAGAPAYALTGALPGGSHLFRMGEWRPAVCLGPGILLYSAKDLIGDYAGILPTPERLFRNIASGGTLDRPFEHGHCGVPSAIGVGRPLQSARRLACILGSRNGPWDSASHEPFHASTCLIKTLISQHHQPLRSPRRKAWRPQLDSILTAPSRLGSLRSRGRAKVR